MSVYITSDVELSVGFTACVQKATAPGALRDPLMEQEAMPSATP